MILMAKTLMTKHGPVLRPVIMLTETDSTTLHNCIRLQQQDSRHGSKSPLSKNLRLLQIAVLQVGDQGALHVYRLA